MWILSGRAVSALAAGACFGGGGCGEMANGWGGAISMDLVAWSAGACGGVDLVVLVEVGEVHWIGSVNIMGWVWGWV